MSAVVQPPNRPPLAASRIARRSRHSGAMIDVTPQISKWAPANSLLSERATPCQTGLAAAALPASIIRSRKAAEAAALSGVSQLPAIRPTRSSLLRARSQSFRQATFRQTTSIGHQRTIIPVHSRNAFAESSGGPPLPPTTLRSCEPAAPPEANFPSSSQSVSSSLKKSTESDFSNVLTELQLALLESTKQRILSDIASTGRARLPESVVAPNAHPYADAATSRPSLVGGTYSDWELSPDHPPPAHVFNPLARSTGRCRRRRKLQRVSTASSRANFDSSDSSYGGTVRCRGTNVPKLTPTQQAYQPPPPSTDACRPATAMDGEFPDGKSLELVSLRPVCSLSCKSLSPLRPCASHCSTRESNSSAWEESEAADNEDQVSLRCRHTMPLSSGPNSVDSSEYSCSCTAVESGQHPAEVVLVDATTQTTTCAAQRVALVLQRHVHYQRWGHMTRQSSRWKPQRLAEVSESPAQPPNLTTTSKVDAFAIPAGSRELQLLQHTLLELPPSPPTLSIVSAELFSLHFVAPQATTTASKLQRTECPSVQKCTAAHRPLALSTGAALFVSADEIPPVTAQPATETAVEVVDQLLRSNTLMTPTVLLAPDAGAGGPASVEPSMLDPLVPLHRSVSGGYSTRFSLKREPSEEVAPAERVKGHTCGHLVQWRQLCGWR